jgi:hypothetical protein
MARRHWFAPRRTRARPGPAWTASPGSWRASTASTFHRPQGACVMIGAAHEPPRLGQANGEMPSCRLLCGVLEFAGLGHVDPDGAGSNAWICDFSSTHSNHRPFGRVVIEGYRPRVVDASQALAMATPVEGGHGRGQSARSGSSPGRGPRSSCLLMSSSNLPYRFRWLQKRADRPRRSASVSFLRHLGSARTIWIILVLR